MNKEFDIILPDKPKEISEEIKQKNRAMFTLDNERDGVLAKVLIFTKLNQPTFKNEVQEKLQQYYGVEFDKDVIGRALQKLNNLGLLKGITSGDLMTMQYEEMSESQRHSLAKFQKYLTSRIPPQFRKNYTNVIFYELSNGAGIEYIPWCSKLLGFEIKEKKK